MIPAHQSLRPDHLAGVQLIPGLEEEYELVALQAVQDLGHQDLLVARRAARRRSDHGAALGQPLQQLHDLPGLPPVAVTALFLGGGDDGLVELLQEQGHLPVHDIAQDIVGDVEQDGQDDAGDGGIEGGIDARKDVLHAVQSRIHRGEADPLQAHQQADEGAQDAQAGHNAGDLGRHALPAVQPQHVLVHTVIQVADD